MAKDPIDNYEEAKKTAAQRRREDENNLAVQWQQQLNQTGQPDPDLTAQLMRGLGATRRAAINKYKSPLAGPGFDTDADNLIIEGIKTFNPQAGASLNTHVTNQLKRLHRRNLQHQSVRSTEHDAAVFGQADVAKAELMDELGRDPTDQELHARINEMLPGNRQVDYGRFQTAMSRRAGTIQSSAFESNPQEFHAQLQQQNLEMLPYELNQQQLQVYNHIFGKGGQKATQSTGDIARLMGISEPAVSRHRKAILAKAGVTDDQLGAMSKSPRRRRNQ